MSGIDRSKGYIKAEEIVRQKGRWDETRKTCDKWIWALCGESGD